MTWLVVMGLLTSEPAPQRLMTSRVEAGLGLVGTGYAVRGSRLGEAMLLPNAFAQLVLSGLVIDAGLLASAPLSGGGAVAAVQAQARVGYAGERFSVVAGVVAQLAPEALPSVQWLPSFRGSVSFGQAGVTLGVLDAAGLIPAHLSIDVFPSNLGRFSLGWVGPIGLVASVDLGITTSWGLRMFACAFRLNTVETALVSIGGRFGGVR
jgi:hypothetical protein